MAKGYVLFVVKKNGYEPYFVKFAAEDPNARKNFKVNCTYVSDIKAATIYPVYEAAEVVYKLLKKEKNKYLHVHIFDTKGNPCTKESKLDKGDGVLAVAPGEDTPPVA